ncbi:MAG: PEP-CTERM sorting domain-containing protein [Rubrivivax sp.]|nr:PEP-CTERM sorting domain-containing protein [Rubrivivax sp.]
MTGHRTPTPPTSVRPHPLALAAAAALCLAAAGASADVRYEGGGDFGGVPMYRALNYGYVFNGDTGDFQMEGLDYVSNVAPRFNSTEHGRIDLDGATAWYTGSAQYSGFYAARTYAAMTVENAQADHTYYWVAGQGTSTSITFFDASAAAARAEFRWHVSGNSSSTSGTGEADGRVDFFATTETGRSWLELFDGSFEAEGSLTGFGPGDYTYRLPVEELGKPINLYFWTSAYVWLKPGDLGAGDGTTITADYSRTIVLEGVDLYDADDNLLNDWSMVDTDSGTTLFTEAGRQVPVLPPAPIPEPGTWAMMLGGLASMGWMRRRRNALRQES